MASLVKKIDQRLQAATGMTARPLGAYVLFVNDGGGELDQRLRGLAEKEALRGVTLGAGAPPPDYALAVDADVTVVVYNPARRGQQKVTANFALRKGELTDVKADEIVKAVAAVLPPHLHASVATSREKEQHWRYTFAKPAGHWYMPDFNDLSWKTGPGGFGTAGTPGAVVRTAWNTDAIWLRREVTLPEGPFTNLHLQLHHDEDVEVYLNGVLAAKLTGYTTGYREAPISDEARKALRPGANVMAVSCRQTGGGQYIDVGLVELKRSPALSRVVRRRRVVGGRKPRMVGVRRRVPRVWAGLLVVRGLVGLRRVPRRVDTQVHHAVVVAVLREWLRRCGAAWATRLRVQLGEWWKELEPKDEAGKPIKLRVHGFLMDLRGDVELLDLSGAPPRPPKKGRKVK